MIPWCAPLVTQQISVLQVEKRLLQKGELGSTLCNMLLQLATLKFVAWQVEHAVVIRATKTRSTCNATMLLLNLNENVARITWALPGVICTLVWLLNGTDSGYKIGPITSRCSGIEPALSPVPSRGDRRPDSRKRRKSSPDSRKRLKSSLATRVLSNFSWVCNEFILQREENS